MKSKTVVEGWEPSRHGIPSSYRRGCRCSECRRDNADRQGRGGYSRANREARLAERELVDGRLVHPKPYGGHGSWAAYTSCGCRCHACIEAASTYRAEHKGTAAPRRGS